VVVILLRKIIAIQLNLSANPGAQICLICVRNGWTNRYVLHNPRGRAALILLLVGCADSAAPATNAGGAGASGGSSNTGTTTTPTGEIIISIISSSFLFSFVASWYLPSFLFFSVLSFLKS